jgi:SHS2 domain-containing protein
MSVSDPRALRAELFPHDADVGVRGVGATVGEAFEQAALALTRAITEVPVESIASVEISCRAADVESLLVAWLNAIIYEMAVRQMLFGRFVVDLEGTQLHAELWGEPVDPAKHAPACEPKGATYTGLRVTRDADGAWSASCVVDV